MFLMLLGLVVMIWDVQTGAGIFIAGFLLTVLHKIVSDTSKIESSNSPPPIVEKEQVCPPHKWVYDEQGHLYCSICKMRPGQLISPRD